MRVGMSHLQMSVSRAPSIALADASLDEEERVLVPDVCLDGAALSIALDVSVCYAEADSYLPKERGQAAAKWLDVLARRAVLKSKKYSASCAKQGIYFVPFVMDSHGALHSSAVSVIDRLAEYGACVVGCQEQEFAGYLRRRVAIALQRGNARLDRLAVTKSRNSYGAAVARGLVVPRH